MKKLILICFALVAFQANYAQQSAPTTYEYKIFTLVESVVYKDNGRSAIVLSDENGVMIEQYADKVNYENGVSLKNIQYNDKVVTQNLNALAKEGWILDQVAVSNFTLKQADLSFITRYIMKRPVVTTK
ncbi:MAG: hypothetical protein IT236_00030 [Bacteroidia bacterium]|nr:hypothetical protein [Bacteroidia bacterium]